MPIGGSITTYPTPNISDSIETEVVSIGAGKYTPLAYGTPYPNVEHGAFPKDLPDHILVHDAPADNEGKYRKRIWVNSRIDQDLYNFQIDFEGNNPAYPIYSHEYIVLRDGYTPLPILSPDPLDSNAKLISERLVNQVDPQELGSQFVRIVRVYHTLPGQITFSIEFPYSGQTDFPRITTKQKVAVGNAIPLPSGSQCPVIGYQNAKLITQQIQKTDNGNIDEINGVYEIVPSELDQVGVGYTVGYHGASQDYPFVSWEFVALKDTYQRAADLSACPIAGYEALVLVDEKISSDPGQNVLYKVSRRYEKLPGLLMYQISYDNNDISYPIIKTAQRKLRGSYTPGVTGADNCPIQTYDDLVLFEQHMMPTDIFNIIEDQRIYEKNPNGIIITHDFDSELNSVVQTTRQKIAAGVVPNIGNMVLHLEEQPIDKWRTLQVITSLRELPPDKVEYQTGRYPFPTLLTGIALQKVELTSATDSAVIWYPNTLRPLQNVPAVFRITTSFHIDRPPNVDVFVLPTRDLVFRGRSFQIAINNVLSDKIALSVTFSGDTTYGDLTEGITFEPTNPTATDYYKAIGSLQVVGCDITRLRGNIWVLQTTEVVLA